MPGARVVDRPDRPGADRHRLGLGVADVPVGPVDRRRAGGGVGLEQLSGVRVIRWPDGPAVRCRSGSAPSGSPRPPATSPHRQQHHRRGDQHNHHLGDHPRAVPVGFVSARARRCSPCARAALAGGPRAPPVRVTPTRDVRSRRVLHHPRDPQGVGANEGRSPDGPGVSRDVATKAAARSRPSDGGSRAGPAVGPGPPRATTSSTRAPTTPPEPPSAYDGSFGVHGIRSCQPTTRLTTGSDTTPCRAPSPPRSNEVPRRRQLASSPVVRTGLGARVRSTARRTLMRHEKASEVVPAAREMNQRLSGCFRTAAQVRLGQRG